jgi:hypothetical protein
MEINMLEKEEIVVIKLFFIGNEKLCCIGSYRLKEDNF